MAVPTRPAGGAIVESSWGQVVHDTAVAQDIQAGTVNVSIAGTQASVNVTFPRPFASNPAVAAVIGPQGAGPALSATVQVASLSPTVVSLRISNATSITYTLPVQWVAVGARA